jgi:hypothetical protein
MKQVIVLIGKILAAIMQWITEEVLPRGLIKPEHVQLFKVTDDPYKAFCFIRGECKIE